MRKDKLADIDKAILDSIGKGEIPGAVLWLESKGEVYKKAYGYRCLVPEKEKMSLDTIFDLASLTKVVATMPALLRLRDEGKLSLDDTVSKWIPEFLDGGVRPEASDPKPEATDRQGITLRELLSHESGLPPGIFLSEGDFWGYSEGVQRAATVGLRDKPRTRFRYSDVNYILLGEIVRRASGERMDQYAAKHIFTPLGMTETGYNPDSRKKSRIAPTTYSKNTGLLRGQVHDPTASRMEGVAGHAGLFAPVQDVASYVRYWLTGTMANGETLLKPSTLAEATSNQLPQELEARRGLGWDISSSFSNQRGEAFPESGYGHTGWTGTSIWVDPASKTFVILLANRNHPSESGRIKALREHVGTLAAEAVGYAAPVKNVGRSPDAASPTASPENANSAESSDVEKGSTGVLNGIDVLERDHFSELAGLRIGLITNHTGINRQRRSTIDLLASAPNVELKTLFSPEHGIRGALDQASIADDVDTATGLPVYSLYTSDTRKPSAAQMEGLDALVFDIQDIGCRFYTYISTMGLALEAAKEAGIRFIVLDRVNPIGGLIIDGPLRTGEGNDFVAFHDIPVQHGMTVGELARLFNAERKVGAELTVIPVEGWDPAMTFEETGLPWVNPSPNIRSLTQAMIYPGIGLVEFTNLSVGRGTAAPFEHVGAPWINGGRLAQILRKEKLPGVEILPDRFTPESSHFKGEDCAGVRFYLSDRQAFRPLDLGISLMKAIQTLYPKTFQLTKRGNVLLRNQETLDAILADASLDTIRALWQPGLEKFKQRRSAYLLYPRQ